MKKQFIIISLKHSDKDGICFWKADDAGYTNNPIFAGIYDEDRVINNLSYYHDGQNIAVDIRDNETLKNIGVIGKPNIKNMQQYMLVKRFT